VVQTVAGVTLEGTLGAEWLAGVGTVVVGEVVGVGEELAAAGY